MTQKPPPAHPPPVDEDVPTMQKRRRAPATLPRPTPHLYLVINCERPFDLPLACELSEATRVLIRRSGAAEATRAEVAEAPEGTQRTIHIKVRDNYISREPRVELRREESAWTLRGKNDEGVFLYRRGASLVPETALSDGDLLEVGQTFFLYRVLVPADARFFTPQYLANGPQGTATLHPDLVRQLETLRAIAEGNVLGAKKTVPIHLHGPTGAGKELLARAAHVWSRREKKPVLENCGKLDGPLINSTLFGHVEGAFTGATGDRLGRIRQADGSTLFLDEVGELPPGTQVALLRVLDEKTVVPEGGTAPFPVNFQLVSATNRDLLGMVREGSFRQDLYYRLIGGQAIELLPLCARLQDLGLIIRRIFEEHTEDRDWRLTTEAVRALFEYEWPGNIRELSNCLAAAQRTARGQTITVDDLSSLTTQRAAAPLSVSRPRRNPADRPTREALVALLIKAEGNMSAVARGLDTTRMNVMRWRNEYAIKEEESKPPKK